MLVFVAFALKLVIVAALARAVRPRCPDALGAALAGWVIATALVYAAMLALSAFEALTRGMFWAALLAGAAAAALSLRRHRALPALPRAGRALLLLFGLFWAAFAARALLFQDFSADAPAVHLARIGLWLHHHSILVHMPALFATVFSSDWNGELIGLFYGLATGDLQGPVFANAEVLALAFFACVWVARRVGASWRWAYAVAALAALCPAALGLATTVKGDLLAAAAAVLALGWALTLRAGGSGFAAALLVACVTLAAGAKLTAAVPAAALGLLGLAFAGPRPFFKPRALALGGACAAIFLVRYGINLAVYGNPIQRMAGEAPVPGRDTFVENIAMVWERSFGFAAHLPGGPERAWAIGGGLGVTGFVFVAALAALIHMRRRPDLAALGALAAALLAACFAVPAFWWGYRYFLPSILGILVLVLARAEPRRAGVALAAAALLAGVNVSYLTWTGELNADMTFRQAFVAMIGKSPVARTLAISEARRRQSQYEALRLDREQTLRIVMFQNDRDPGREILPFIGSRAQHELFLVRSQAEALPAARQRRADFIVLAKPAGADVAEPVLAAARAAGYVWIEDNEAFAIAARADLPEAARGPVTKPAPKPIPEDKLRLWTAGAHAPERHRDYFMRWIEPLAEMRVPLEQGGACLVLEAFAAGRPFASQIVRVDGAEVTPAELELGGTAILHGRSFRLRVRGSGAAALLRFTATMPETKFPADPRRIAYGVVHPSRWMPLAACD